VKIGIVGLGLMGGSIAKSLNQNHFIIAYDVDRDAIDYALSQKIIQAGDTNLENFFHGTKVIYLCLYPQSILQFIQSYQNQMDPGTIVIEISGVKTKIINAVTPFLNNNIDMVFTHPIAGREKVGVKYSKDSIFQNANYVIVPTDKNKAESLSLVENLAREMKFKNITQLTKEQHDDFISYTSQLTHVLSLALVNSEDTNLDTKRFIGDSYRDLTRISMINEPLWSELFLENKEYLIEKIERLEKSLSEYKSAINNNDIEKLKELMLEAKRKRMKIEGDDPL